MPIWRIRMAMALHESEMTEERAEREFFETVKIFHRDSSMESQTIHRAYAVIKKVSTGKMRHEKGKSYISHPRTIAFALMFLNFYDYVSIVVALLHDLNEDFPETWPHERLLSEFGLEIAHEVESLTRPPLSADIPTKQVRDTLYSKSLRRASRRVKIIKILDRLHNMKTFSLYSEEKRGRKIKETVDEIMPIAIEIGFSDEIEFFLKQWVGVTL